MATSVWKGIASNIYGVAANWVGGVPTSVDTADISVNIGGSFQPRVVNAGISVGAVNVDASNTLTIFDHATLAVNGTMAIGSASGGTGGTVDVNGNGNATPASLSAGVLIVGQASHGALVIRNGATVGSAAPITVGSGTATGIITIGGAGASAEGAGTLSINVNLANAGSQLVFHTSNAASLSKIVSGSGSVTVNSAGQTVTLSGANTYSGGTAVNAGTAVAGVGTAGSVGAITSSAFGTGAIALNGGALQAGIASLAIANAITVGSSGGSIDNNGGLLTVTGPIGSAAAGGTLTFTNAVGFSGTTFLSGVNTYTQDTVIASGAIVDATISGALSAASNLTVNGQLKLITSNTVKSLSGSGTVTAGGAYALTLAPAGGSTTFSGQLTDTSPGILSLTLNGTVTQILSGTSNNYHGATTITSGTLQAGAANAFSAASATTVQANGILDLGNAAQTINNISLAGGGIRNGTLTGAVLSTGGTIQASLAGASSLGAASGNTVLVGTNTYSGATQVDASATLAAEFLGKLSANSAHTINGTLLLSDGGTTILSLSGSGQVTTNLPAGATTLTIAPTSGSTTFSGVITESQTEPLSLTLNGTGTGTQVLSGSNTYTGATTVTSGTLKAGKANAFSAASATAVQAHGILDLGGFAQTINIVTVDGGGLIKNGTLTGAVTSTGSTLTASLTGASSLHAASSFVTIMAGTANSYTGATLVDATADLAGQTAGSLSINSAYTVNGFLFLQANNSIQSLAGTGSVFGSGTTLTIAASGAPTTFSGSLQDHDIGNLSLTLNGTQVLSGTNTYTGATTITQGTLALSGAGTIASSAVTVAAAGTFDISGISGGGVNVNSLAGAGTVKLGGKGLGIANEAAASTGLTFVGSGSGDAVFFDLATGNNAFSLVGTNFSNWNDSLDSINLFANSGNDIITGSAHNDTFFGGTGNDTFDGGAGTDTIVYSTALAGSQIVWNPGHPVDIFVKTGPSAGKFDSLTNVEFAKFSDQTISLASVFAADYSYSAVAGTALKSNVLTNDTDPNSLALSAVVKTGPLHGTLALLASGDFAYSANAGFVGTDSFVYTASDILGNNDVATVTISVAASPPPPPPPPPGQPVANADSYSTAFNTTLIVTAANSVLANDTDPNGLLLSAALATGPAHGTLLALNKSGAFIYTPTTGFSGTDSFTYTATDSIFTSLPGMVSITVGAPPPPPPPANFAITDTTTGVTSNVPGDAYTGPVAGLQFQFIYTGPDNTNVTGQVPNSFIHTGSGFDAIDVSAVGGINVLDGGTNSNFLVGGKAGAGSDTFFVDDRSPPGDIWSTVGNFHAGDAATIFGITQNGFSTTWVDGEGATGFTGVTLHVTAPGVPTASITLAGYSVADLSNGRLSQVFGTEADGTPYLYIHGDS